MITCVLCGHSNREPRKYCASCGGRLGWLCKQCGFFNYQDESHCGGCGKLENKQINLSKKKSAKPAASIVPPPQQFGNLQKDDSASKLADFPDNIAQEVITEVINKELDRIAEEGEEPDSTGVVSQDDINKLFD